MREIEYIHLNLQDVLQQDNLRMLIETSMLDCYDANGKSKDAFAMVEE